ncbi:MAG TPA: hypothetical protein VFX53_05125 [Pedococcus sp.]|nr:hypothetical protein [Pedococcus sp.]
MTNTDAHRMSPEDAAEQAGCWLEGSRGWTASGELVNIAARHGMPLSLDDRAVVDAYLARADAITLSDGSTRDASDITGLVIDQGELADTALDYLNEHVAPEGYAFGWRDGEFFLWTDEQ